jgi:hypothetical protein
VVAAEAVVSLPALAAVATKVVADVVEDDKER